MFWNILKKDLKRKKTMNIILFLFFVLASMFVASGLSNIVTVMNGTDYYLNQAGIGDYVVITQMGDGGLPEILDEEKAVSSYKTENVIFATKESLSHDGEKVDTKNTLILQSMDDPGIHYFDMNNKEVTNVEEGKFITSMGFLKKNNLKVGDKITIEHGETKLTLEIAGACKDALLGSDFMGNTRFLLHDSDFQKFMEDETLANYKGTIFYIFTEDTSALASDISQASNVIFDSPRQTIKMCYVMDMIVAFIILVLSVCLVIVSFVSIKFSITFSIMEDYREIGVMKAIGIPNPSIRGMYIIKYFMLVSVGAMIGFFASVPFADMLLKQVTEKMVLGHNGGLIVNLIGAFLVVLVTILFAYLCTSKVKKSTPVDAIRNGQTGERFRKKAVYRIGKSHTKPSMYMAMNDVLSSPKRFLTIIISFFICSIFMLGLVMVTETMKSSKLITTFCQESDVYVTSVENFMKSMKKGGEQELEEQFATIEEKLAEEGMPCTVSMEVQYKYKVEYKGKTYSINCLQGKNRKAANYEYTKGSAPQNANEVAITEQVADLIDAKIGDVIQIVFDDRTEDCMVVGYFQTMNQLGEAIRLHEDAPTDMVSCSSAMAYQIDFLDNPDEKEIDARIEKIKIILDQDEVFDAAGYCADCIGVVGTMEAVQYMLLLITIIVVVLVTILMERSFIADEKGQIALLKAIGFRNKDIIKWHVYRFLIVAVIVELLAVALVKPITMLWCNPIFGMMGAYKIDYYMNWLKLGLLYPGIILVVTVMTAWLTAQYVRTIKSKDTANIE